MKKSLTYLLFVILLVLSSGCGKKKEPCPVFFPLHSNTRLNFISYVTNQRNEILYPFEYYERQHIYTDSIGARLIHHYVERNKMSAFYTDDSCSIWNLLNIDLSALVVNYGFSYQDSVHFSYWKPVIKIYDGVGTTWSLRADTIFTAVDPSGQEHQLTYDFSGTARYQGWTKVIVPENRTKELTVQQVQWRQIKYFLYDQTTGDTLMVQNGSGNEYFEPELGLIRSTVDYTLKHKDKPRVFQKSTWELYSKLVL